MNHKEMQLAKATMKELDEAIALDHKNNPSFMLQNWRLNCAKRTLQRLIDGKLEHGAKKVKIDE